MPNLGWPHSYADDFGLNVAKGLIPNHSMMYKFGRNTSITTTDEDVWDGGGIYDWISTAGTASVVSTDAKDTSAGVGARTIQIQGLDENWGLQSETITLNGTTPVITTNSWMRIFRMKVMSVGSEKDNAGTITATVDSKSAAIISIGFNQTLMALYTIPVGYIGYLEAGWISAGRKRSASVDAAFWARLDADTSTSPFQIKHTMSLSSTGTCIFQRTFRTPMQLPAKTDLIVRASADADSDVSAGFDIMLVED